MSIFFAIADMKTTAGKSNAIQQIKKKPLASEPVSKY